MNKTIDECVNFAEMSNSPNEDKLYSVVYSKKRYRKSFIRESRPF